MLPSLEAGSAALESNLQELSVLPSLEAGSAVLESNLMHSNVAEHVDINLNITPVCHAEEQVGSGEACRQC